MFKFIKNMFTSNVEKQLEASIDTLSNDIINLMDEKMSLENKVKQLEDTISNMLNPSFTYDNFVIDFNTCRVVSIERDIKDNLYYTIVTYLDPENKHQEFYFNHISNEGHLRLVEDFKKHLNGKKK